MSPRDENDRARDGTLPPDPFEDADPIGGASAPAGLRWRTYGEILSATEEKPREWLVPDLIPFGALVQLVGLAKRGGKTTLAWAIVAAAELGYLFLGALLPRTGAVILSEEGDHDLAERIRRFGMDPGHGVVLSRGVLAGVPEWAALMREGTALALARGHRLLVVDTFAFWAALEGASENDAGTVIKALRPLQEAADQGLAVLLIHHVGKAKDREGGVAARGSSAIAGAVEATIEVRNEGTEGQPNRRLLHIESRAVGVRDVVVELVQPEAGPARFELVGDARKVQGEEVEAAILAFLRARRGQWFPSKDIVTEIPKRGGDIRTTLTALAHARRVARMGEGKRGDPYLYAALGTPPPRAPDPSSPGETDSGPEPAPGVPGAGFQPPPRAADVSGPAVPALHMKAGTGTETEARGKNTNRRGMLACPGAGNATSARGGRTAVIPGAEHGRRAAA
ncbi:MAG: AAA family ATPase [Dehalococcoidia bacterium]